MKEREKKEREKQLVGFRAWKDEYDTFKAICHEMRTTPTAKLNELMRRAIAEYREQNSGEEQ